MAFVFAGKSVLELIEGKLFEPTLISGAPEISWLGIYPYMETFDSNGQSYSSQPYLLCLLWNIKVKKPRNTQITF